MLPCRRGRDPRDSATEASNLPTPDDAEGAVEEVRMHVLETLNDVSDATEEVTICDGQMYKCTQIISQSIEPVLCENRLVFNIP